MNSSYTQNAIFEHTFWIQVLKDHSQFILDSLAEKEKEEIQIAKTFIQSFSTLLDSVKGPSHNIEKLTMEAKAQALALKEFKLSLLKKHLTTDFTIHLTPTFLNHMVNELDEYLLILGYLEKKQVPPVFHELHHHLLWTLDAAGHAGAISDSLDAVEKKMKQKSMQFSTHFEHFYLKAVELTGYLRTNLESFPALKKMNKDVRLEIELFQVFLHEIEELELSNEMLSTFSALMADHMMREECYYLTKLAQSTNTENPSCSPTSSNYK
ncbi:DUF2935 domain-containing protein [Priestia endophytica]|uniref:DUF2935 domain-containing protein n=1 Tax=Priestia endophytica TaxID=135735 RepID=UPI0022827FE0|nr:DUF2935 domain-containing protein [Priestia endophytica]MCY8234189.1 DUF2935 domain-containing protein [Priestia endophytica]